MAPEVGKAVRAVLSANDARTQDAEPDFVLLAEQILT
jgi:hypothetical protein